MNIRRESRVESRELRSRSTCPSSRPRLSTLDPRPAVAAFTLIEIMVVVGIIGLIAAMGVPTLWRMAHREGFSKEVGDVMELCGTARARAILQGKTTVLVFHPKDFQCTLGAATNQAAASPVAPGHSSETVTFGDGVQIEMLDVNLLEYKDQPAASVRFFPNGTSDEMTLILRSNNNEWRKISLEISTGLASLDSDPNRWR